MNPELPRSFKLTRHSPTVAELEFMHEWVKNNLSDDCNVLEFGAGPTTWAIFKAVKCNRYVVVEDHAQSLKALLLHLPDLEVVNSTWYKIPEDIKYDFVFVDSSAGYPPGVSGLHRDEAAKYGERLLAPGGHIMLHDWHGRSGRGPRHYLESSGDYELVASLNGRTGVGIYRSLA
jgi:hypothetical protein